jgi:hypothetical protein
LASDLRKDPFPDLPRRHMPSALNVPALEDNDPVATFNLAKPHNLSFHAEIVMRVNDFGFDLREPKCRPRGVSCKANASRG